MRFKVMYEDKLPWVKYTHSLVSASPVSSCKIPMHSGKLARKACWLIKRARKAGWLGRKILNLLSDQI